MNYYIKKYYDKKKILLSVTIMLLIIAMISAGITYAYLSLMKVQDNNNTFKTGCLNVTIEGETDSINIDHAIPKTDLKGLEGKGYTFTIHNTCETSANYEINLEELSNPDNANTLNAEYLKVALSSNTFDNIISKLSENTLVTKHIEGSYKSYNLYNGTIGGGAQKEFTLKEWVDYNVTKEQGQNKTINTKINVVSGTNNGKEIIPSNTSEIKFNKKTGTIIGDTVNIKYCTSEGNKCVPSTSITATSNKIKVDLNKIGIICANINSKQTVCSNPIYIAAQETFEYLLKFNKSLVLNGKVENFSDSIDNLNQNGIYEAEDDDGISYYFRGNVETNHVAFGRMGLSSDGDPIWWRIIRINGDGTIRLIYAGTESDVVNYGETYMLINYGKTYTYSPNGLSNNSKYVGFEYQMNSEHIKSNALEELNRWFEANLKDELEAGYIDTNAGFCGDRQVWDGKINTRAVAPTGGEYYLPNARTEITHQPTFKCADMEHDLFTYTRSEQGTKSLSFPIGLPTVDEVVYAGGTYRNGGNYYLSKGKAYWTMSPSEFISSAKVYYVTEKGNVIGNTVSDSVGLRPVINIKPEVLTVGDGSYCTPFANSSSYLYFPCSA